MRGKFILHMRFDQFQILLQHLQFFFNAVGVLQRDVGHVALRFAVNGQPQPLSERHDDKQRRDENNKLKDDFPFFSGIEAALIMIQIPLLVHGSTLSFFIV